MPQVSKMAIVYVFGVLVFLFAALSGIKPMTGLEYFAGALITVFMVIYFLQKLTGLKKALAFFATASIFGYFFELIGVKYSFIFGAYHYTDFFPFHFYGVPLIIPLAWFIAVLTSLFAAKQILPKKASAGTIILTSSLFAVIYDIPVEYLAKNVTLAWIWNEGGILFGVPLINFIGWFLVTMLILAVGKKFWRDLDHVRPAYRDLRTILFSAYGFTCIHFLASILFG